MEYNKLVAVTGLPGLFELVSSKNDGAIVRSLDDKSTKFVSSRIHNFSHLESIEIYTVRDNVNLAEVFLAMGNAGDTLPNEKDNAAVKSYFEKVYPDMDFDRVYASDMKKMVKWFDILQKNKIEVKVPELQDEEENDATTVEEVKEEKKSASKKEETADKPAKKKAEAADEPAEKKAPAKKAAAKKKAEPSEEGEEKKPAAKKTATKKAAPKKSDK